LDSKQSILLKNLERYDYYIGATNAKASIVIAWNGIVIGTTLLKYDDFNALFSSAPNAIHFVNILLVLISLACIYSIYTVFKVINPYLKDKATFDEKKSLLFYGSVASMPYKEYQNQIQSLSEEDLVEDLIEQSYILAKGLDGKMKAMACSIHAIVFQLAAIGLIAVLKGVIIYVK
jgi:hypothetical protein